MEAQPNNIDNALREKFEGFAPPPPEHVWEGVAAGIGTQTTAWYATTLWRGIGIAASVLIIIGLAFWWFMPREEYDSLNEVTQETTITSDETPASDIVVDETSQTDIAEETDTNTQQDQQLEFSDNTKIESRESVPEEASIITTGQENKEAYQAVLLTEETADYRAREQASTAGEEQLASTSIYALTAYNGEINNDLPEVGLAENATPPAFIPEIEQAVAPASKGWSHGVYFTPEAMLNDFDSVTILPAYSLNYEPSYHFNNHLFVRFGAGVQYARDRGFARLNYDQKQVVGTYEDVYDVTFQNIDGEIIPTYHTKTTEVWEDINHIEISEVTNQYVYLQVPALVGYHNKGKRVNWFFYGGPAVNMMIGKWIEDPSQNLEGATNVLLKSKLPERSPYYFQLWLGAGIEYKFNNKLGLALEPNYRYYFNQVYQEEEYQVGLSSFGLRVGLVFKVK